MSPRRRSGTNPLGAAGNQPTIPPRQTLNRGMAKVKIGIIGGSGVDAPDILQNKTVKDVDTPFGKPSDKLIIGTVEKVPCVILARHGEGHRIMPSNVNYRANMFALKQEDCTHVLVTTACGSLQQNIHPGDIVILDQFIDRTTKRHMTFFDGSEGAPAGICHIPMATPFCANTSQILIDTSKKLGYSYLAKGTVICIEGPRFSSKAESCLFHQWGADVINMTTVPEVVLAKEVGLSYSALALVTDYDSWRDDVEPVSVANVLKTFKENADKAKEILIDAIPKIAAQDWSKMREENQKIINNSILSTH